MNKTELTKLNSLFYDPKQGFINLTQLINKANESNIKLSKDEIKEFYLTQPINQVMKPIQEPKKYNSYIGYHSRYKYQMDIIVYNRYKYNNYNYILVVVDIYSRYADTEPMKTREQSEILTSYKNIIERMGIPETIKADNEFNKKAFLDVFTQHNTTPYFSNPYEIHKNPIVERLNGTIALRIQKIRIALKRNDWPNYLSDVIYNYNNTLHSTTKQTPYDIFINNVQSKQKITESDDNNFLPNDKVRLLMNKKQFQKGDMPKYDTNIYIVEKVNTNTIKLHNIDHLYKYYELKKINHITDLDETIDKPTDQIKENKLKILYKQLSLDSDNITDVKRKRIPNKKYLD